MYTLLPCRTTLKAHTRKNHPETSIAEDGEDHCYFNKKEPSPPPKPVKETKKKFKNQESVEKMSETKSKYFVMRHNTCCRTRSFEQNIEIKNRKTAAEKRLLEGPKKRGRKPKNIFEAAVGPEDPEVAEKRDPTWSPTADESEVADSSILTNSSEKSNRRSSYVTTVAPAEDFTQEDIHKIHENRAPDKRRSAPPKRYSPERELVQVKKRAKSPPMRRPRSPKEKRTSKSPFSKKRKRFKGNNLNEYSNPSYVQQQPSLLCTPYDTVKERRKSAKQYEKRLKKEKPTLYAELMHVKKLKSVPMVVDQSVPMSLTLMDHCYCRENNPAPQPLPEQLYDDMSCIHPDLSIVATPDVADFEECLTDDVQESPSPVHSSNGPVPPSGLVSVLPGGQGRGRQRGRPSGRTAGRPAERASKHPVAMRGVLTGGSVSTLQLTNNLGQFSKLGTLLSDDMGQGVNVRITGTSAGITPSGTQQHAAVRTVMTSPHDDSMEFDSDTFLASGVEMHDDILKVAADMFISESEMLEEITETSDCEHQVSSNLNNSGLETSPNSILRYPKPVLMSRPDTEMSPATTVNSSQYRNRVITISQEGLVEHTLSDITESVPQISTETSTTENIPKYQSDATGVTVETVNFQSHEDIKDTSIPVVGTEMEAQDMVSESVSETDVVKIPQAGDSIVTVPASSNLQNMESEPGMTNELAQELVQAILDHSRTCDTELNDIQLNEADYNMLLGSRNVTTTRTVIPSGGSIQTTPENTQQQSRSVDHQYF